MSKTLLTTKFLGRVFKTFERKGLALLKLHNSFRNPRAVNPASPGIVLP
jgi:hypothetical protein